MIGLLKTTTAKRSLYEIVKSYLQEASTLVSKAYFTAEELLKEHKDQLKKVCFLTMVSLYAFSSVIVVF